MVVRLAHCNQNSNRSFFFFKKNILLFGIDEDNKIYVTILFNKGRIVCEISDHLSRWPHTTSTYTVCEVPDAVENIGVIQTSDWTSCEALHNPIVAHPSPQQPLTFTTPNAVFTARRVSLSDLLRSWWLGSQQTCSSWPESPSWWSSHPGKWWYHIRVVGIKKKHNLVDEWIYRRLMSWWTLGLRLTGRWFTLSVSVSWIRCLASLSAWSTSPGSTHWATSAPSR